MFETNSINGIVICYGYYTIFRLYQWSI